MAAVKARAKNGLRPIFWQIRAASIMLMNAPIWIIIIATPVQIVSRPASSWPVNPCALNDFSNTLRCRSIAKKPMPQRPITPEQASSMPRMAFFRQRGSAKSAP